MSDLEFYIISWNSDFCAELQCRTIAAFCKDPYKIVICDSNCGEYPDKSKALADTAVKYGADLVVLPNELRGRQDRKGLANSHILGEKLNWVYYNIILTRKPKYFGFVDHDMFMYEDFRITDVLDKHGMWGDVIPKEEKWILHPWLAFFKLDFLNGLLPDFRPNFPTFDTGGMLWDTVIKPGGLSSHVNLYSKLVQKEHLANYPFSRYHSPAKHPDWPHLYIDGRITAGNIPLMHGFIHILNSAETLLHPKAAYVLGWLECAMHAKKPL